MQQKRKVSFVDDCNNGETEQTAEESIQRNLPTLHRMMSNTTREVQQRQSSISSISKSPPKLLPSEDIHVRSSTNLLELSQMFEQMQSSVIQRDSTVHPKLLGLTSSPTTPEVGIGHVCAKPRKLEPLKHKIPQTRNNLAGLRLPANYSGKWRDWNEPEIFSINQLQN